MRIWTINANQIKLFTMKMIKENLHIRRLNKRIEIKKMNFLDTINTLIEWEIKYKNERIIKPK